MYLCLSLGHNSSAVLIEHGQAIGYEEERLSKIKSDSAFPVASIDRIFQVVGDYRRAEVQTIYISHWFDNFDPYTTENKYYNAAYLTNSFPNAKLVSTGLHSMTHHDAHAFSAMGFYSHYREVAEGTIVLVIDGFGNHQEVASIYRYSGKQLHNIGRIYGYEHSLGLLYQYAAEAVGMDGINDVYKFLGYRTHLPGNETARCNELAYDIAFEYERKWGYMPIFNKIDTSNKTQLIDYDKLKKVKERCIEYFAPIIDDDVFASRVRVGYVVQKVLEECVLSMLRSYKFSNLIVTGGVFHNVRLNDKIRRAYREIIFSVMPLAGDQGAALGMAYRDDPSINKIFADLCWGPRDIPQQLLIEVVETNNEGIDYIAEMLANDVIVNVFHGPMEYGPRALCNTSTLALCKRGLVDAINTANGRTTVMPMAPVMLQDIASYLFNEWDLHRTIGSDKFMITAHDFVYNVKVNELGGAMHEDLNGSYSGRPQIISDKSSFMYKLLTVLLKKYGIRALINTSLNIHGQPIIYSIDDLYKLHFEWMKTCKLPFETLILEQPQ